MHRHGVAERDQPSVAKIEVSGTAFRVTRSDGSVKQGVELHGAVLVFNIAGSPVRIRIDAITPDPNDNAVLVHDFRVDGLEAGSDVFELICTAGAKGKCVRFGYHPWKRAPDGRPMRGYYAR